jgi:hypothetical protein
MLCMMSRKAAVKSNPPRMRLAGRILAAVTVASSLVICTTATAASAAETSGAAQHLTLSTAEQQQLLRLYAAYRHIPVSDIARIRPGTVITQTSNGEEWALEGFTVSSSAPRAVAAGFQDGASSGAFTRLPGKGWRVTALAKSPLACDAGIPASVLRAWGYGSCPAAAPASPRRGTVRPAASGLGSQIAAIAETYAGVVQDNPAETGFSQTADCNPFTYFENPSAPDAGCGTDPTFGVQDHSEFWCSDFAKWVWSQAGVTGPLSDLTPGAGSFYPYGHAEGESISLNPPASSAQVGDAVVLYPPGTTLSAIQNTSPFLSADHVGIITGVNTSAGTIDTVNGDFGGGSSGHIGVWDYGYATPSAFASGSERSGEDWIFISPAGSSLSDTYLATMQDNDNQLYGYQAGTNKGTTLGMAAGTAPSTIGLSDDSTYETAFQDNDFQLYLHSSTGANINTKLGMDSATSPAIAALSTGDQWEAAFQDNDNVLYLRSSSGTNDNTGLGMDPNSSPAIAGSGGGWIVAFEANDNILYITTSAGLKYATTLGMEPFTSPSITATPNGGFVVAFQANNTDLYTFTVHGTSAAAIQAGIKNPTPYGMDSYTSPSIASYTDGTWRVAFQTNDNDLYTYTSDGSDNPSTMQMDADSSPAITAEPDGSYEVAFEANNDTLDVYHTGGSNTATHLGMEAGTSTGISGPYNP